jgi:hypothetical protein
MRGTPEVSEATYAQVSILSLSGKCYTLSMSKNAFSDANKMSWNPDNPQETLVEKNYYYAGFFAAEMSCSVIKAANRNPVGHYYFAIDITVSNADKGLLQSVNKVVMQNKGIISPIKGAFNLSARGKKRVQMVLDFLDRYPIIIGDLARNRIVFLRNALAFLIAHRGLRKHRLKTQVMDNIRMKLRMLKEQGLISKPYRLMSVSKNAIGYFLAGVLDGEGSFGFKKSGNRQQPFFAAAMKDQKIIQLLQEFIGYGKVRHRKDGMYHYEINNPKVLLSVCSLFLTQYPLQHSRQRERMEHLQRILNDYTRNSPTRRDDIV